MAAILRGAGDTLQRQYGAPAVEILFEALDDAEREIRRFFGEGDDPKLRPNNEEISATAE